jgi:hypothetical protein
MTLWFYVKTAESPKTVGDLVCNFNYARGEHPGDVYTWIMEERKEDGEVYWEIMSKYKELKELVLVGWTYKVGDTVVLAEIEDEFLANFLDPLLEKYGFDNLKWAVIPKK